MSNARKISTTTLIIIAILSYGMFFIVHFSVKIDKWYRYKIGAAHLMSMAIEVIREKSVELGLQIDEITDPNKTGLIGPEYSSIVTDQGTLGVKLMSTNPNFAAVIVDLFKKAGLKRGDYIAIGYTGSLPAANIAVLAAAESMGLKPVIITSVSSSSFGATHPNFTWLDMENYLYNKGIISHRSVAASLGGKKDIAKDMPYETKKQLEAAIKRKKLIFIYEEGDINENVIKRLNIYDTYAKGPIKCFVNVGGGHADLGSEKNDVLIPAGLSLKPSWKGVVDKGVIVKMAQRGIPIINLLNIRKLMTEYGLPVLPVPLPKGGEGRIFLEEGYKRYNFTTTVLVTFLLIGLITILTELDLFVLPEIRKKIKHHLKRRGL